MEMKRKQKHLSLRGSNRGFTIIELMIAMVVSLLAMAAIYSTFLAQHKSYQVQQETSDMQQNIRTAMYYMQREIRMAGSNPFNTIPVFGITTAGKDTIGFTEDVRGDAVGVPPVIGPPDGDDTDPDENLTYSFLDSNMDGIKDSIFRNGVLMAQNIDALDFVYLDGNSAAIPFSGTTISALNLSQIRSVQITIVARTKDQLLYGSTNNVVYRNQQGTQIYGPAGDNVSRRRLATLIHCRNIGL
ncbi:MAG: prepilin-type N-terminal cleavage/methylation domain-containing protein [Desulfobacterales bacterium]